MVVLTNSGLLAEIGEDDASRTLDEAIEEAREYLGMGETGEGREQKAERASGGRRQEAGGS
jgi:hypothetical protein